MSSKKPSPSNLPKLPESTQPKRSKSTNSTKLRKSSPSIAWSESAPDSFGAFLRMLRENVGLSPSKLSELTKINPQYIKYLENEEFAKLPPTVYIRGFIARCGKFLGEHHTPALLRLYAARTNQKLETEVLSRRNKSRSNSFLLGPEHLAFILGSFFLLAVAVFVAARFTPFLFAPEAVILNPAADNTIVNFSVLNIEGRARFASRLTLNGSTLYIREKGLFCKAIELEDGVNRIVLAAGNIFGRKIEIVRRVIYIKN